MLGDFRKLTLPAYIARDERGHVYLSTHLSSNQIISHKKAIAILEAALAFYETYTPEQIEAHNNASEKAWYEQMTADDIESLKASKQAKRKKVAGYVYILKASTGHYKIGCTSNPKNRKTMLDILLPFKVETVCIIATDDMYTFEANLHKDFAAQRVNGEWFDLDAEDVEYIKYLASDDAI